MENMNLHEIVTRIIGPISPIGDSAVDDGRFANLEYAIDLANRLLFDIYCVALKCGSEFISVKKAGMRAKKFLTEVRDEIG